MTNRIPAIQKKLRPGEAALIVSPVNRRYFTGFASSDGCLLIAGEGALLLVDGRYHEAARKSVKNCEVRLLGKLSDRLAEFFAEHGVTRAQCETGVSVAATRRLDALAGGVTVEPSEALESRIARLRDKKSAGELRRIREAQRLTDEAFDHICGVIRPGLTELEVALELEFHIRKAGSQGTAFDFIVVSGENSSKPHGVPGGRKIKRGDLVTMDFGAAVDGWRSDMTRTVAVGSAGGRQHEVYGTVLRANLAGLEALRAGAACADVDAAARRVIAAAGYGEYFCHSTGHGVGLDIHEGISLSASSKQVLRTGNVVTVEPGIYLPGEFGVRIEDMAVITPQGHENFTKSSKELRVL